MFHDFLSLEQDLKLKLSSCKNWDHFAMSYLTPKKKFCQGGGVFFYTSSAKLWSNRQMQIFYQNEWLVGSNCNNQKGHSGFPALRHWKQKHVAIETILTFIIHRTLWERYNNFRLVNKYKTSLGWVMTRLGFLVTTQAQILL